VFGADVERWIRSMAARGEEADLVSARKGCKGLVGRRPVAVKVHILQER
jgi:hypothetical protein